MLRSMEKDHGIADKRRGDMIDEKEHEGLLSPETTQYDDDEHGDLKSPLRSVNKVLREAQGIFSNDGEFKKSSKDEHVLVDEVDVKYSPQKRLHQPIEIVVRHNKVVSTSRDESDSDGDEEGGEGRAAKTRVFQLIHEDVEMSPDGSGKSARAGKRSSLRPPFGKGHRRAWSMPNAKGEQAHIAVIHDDTETKEGIHRKRTVKYRLHPQKNDDPNMDVKEVGFEEFSGIVDGKEEDQFEININEEEIVYASEPGNKGKRTVIKRFWEARWKTTNFEGLPDWLQDNEYLHKGHRPPMGKFSSCFKSIFDIHTETGNIWTHMYGCIIFLGISAWFMFSPASLVMWQEKLTFSAFFIGAITCLFLSFIFHTVQCHSPQVGSLISKLDYTGISLLIAGSFVPWIHYGFYCRPAFQTTKCLNKYPQFQLVYISMIVILGISAMIVSLFNKFAEPKFRPVRAAVFVSMGLSSIVPALHLLIVDGISYMMKNTSLGWLLLMGFLYLFGAALYATRVPERIFPGMFDLAVSTLPYLITCVYAFLCDTKVCMPFHSHQLFHTFVVVAAVVHLHGICNMAVTTLEAGSCPEQLLENYGSETNAHWLATYLNLDEPSHVVSWNPTMRSV